MDLISRQEAIEALAEHIMESALMDNPTTASTDIDSYRPIAELPLRDVPSVQPEKTQLSKEDSTKDATFDCISREDAIDAVKQHMNNVSGGNDEYYIAHRHIIELLQIVPTAEPESRREWYMKGYRDAQEKWWRPVSILPDETEVLISHRGAVWEDFATFDDDGQHILMGSGVDADSIDAWMPLPEPYEEGQDE